MHNTSPQSYTCSKQPPCHCARVLRFIALMVQKLLEGSQVVHCKAEENKKVSMSFAGLSKHLHICFWMLQVEHALWALDLRMNWPVLEEMNLESHKCLDEGDVCLGNQIKLCALQGIKLLAKDFRLQ